MKKLKLFLLPLFLFTIILIDNTVSAQAYCFWVGNYSDETFSTIRIRKSGESNFGEDLLPNNMIEPYEHYWIRTGTTGTSIYDIEIKNSEGKALRFTWTGNNGIVYTRSYITLDLSPLNTLMITTNDDGEISYNDAYEDEYGFGNPCDQ